MLMSARRALGADPGARPDIGVLHHQAQWLLAGCDPDACLAAHLQLANAQLGHARGISKVA